MHKYILLVIMTMTTGLLFGDCAYDCGNPCGDPCGQACDCDPCSSCCDDPCDPCDPCNTCACTPCCCEPCDFCPPEPPETCAYNAPKFYDIKCSWDVFVTASFVYAQAKEENLQYAEYTATSVNTDGSSSVFSDFSTLCYDYEPAFKVGLGFAVGCDDWGFYTEYFRYHASVGSGRFSAPPSDFTTGGTSILNCWYLNPFPTSEPTGTVTASTSWRLNLDSVDFNLRRKYFVGKCLVFQTSVGLRARWIDQTQKTTYTNVVAGEIAENTTVTVNNSSDSWGVGPRAALDTEWNFCNSFRLFGNAGVAILYTDYNSVKSNATRTFTGGSFVGLPENYDSSTDFCFLRPDASIALGLGWGDYWCCNDWFFDLSAAYEFHTLWNQNVLSQLTDCSQDPSSFYGDLYIHGLVLTARLDF